jgi:argininosuccinate synthase
LSEVRTTVPGGRAVVTGRRSGAGLYDSPMATYDTGYTFDQPLAEGSVQLCGPPVRAASARDARLSDR